MGSVRRDASVTVVGGVGAAILTLATQSCLAWFLGPAARGEFAICITYATLLTIVFGLGVELAVVYYVGSRRMGLHEAVSGGLVWTLASASAAVGVGLLLAELPVAFFEKAPPGGLRLSLLIVPFSMGAMVLTRALVAVRRLMVLMVVNLVRAVVCLGLTFLFLKPVALGVLGALWGTILAEALLCVVVPVLLVRTNGLRLQVPRWRSLRLLLGYGIRFYFGRLGGQVNVRAGTALLAFLATKEQVGLFAVAMAAMSRTRLLPEAINTVLLPRTADDVSGRPDLVARWCRLSLLLSIPAIFVPLLFARPIVALVFSERFLPIVPLLWVLGLGVVIHGYPKIVGSYFNGIDRPGLTSWAVLSGVGVNLLLLPIFFWRLGLVGTAVAASVGYAIEAAVAIRWFTRASGVSVVRLWKLDRDDRWRIRRVFSRSHATTRADREA